MWPFHPHAAFEVLCNKSTAISRCRTHAFPYSHIISVVHRRLTSCMIYVMQGKWFAQITKKVAGNV